MYYIHIYIYFSVFTYIYIYLWFISLPITLPISQLQGSSNPSQARQMWALHPAVSFGATARYSDWFAIELQGVRCFDVELLKWCTRKRYVVSFLVFLACSECVLVSMSVSMKQLYIQLLLCISKLVPDADSASGAMLIQNVLLGSIPPLGHTFGTKGRRFLLGRCKHPVRLQHVPGEFLGKLWTDSLPRCTNAASDWVKVIISPLAGLILPVALPIRPLGLVGAFTVLACGRRHSVPGNHGHRMFAIPQRFAGQVCLMVKWTDTDFGLC